MSARPFPRPDEGAASPFGVAGSSVRTHPTGARDEAELSGEPGQEILRMVHLPRGLARAGLVVCSPLFEEYQSNHRREVSLASGAAERGIAVHRFDYRGTGNSGGSPAQITLDSMIDDAAGAGQYLADRTQKPILFAGTRLGAIVAAGAARLTGSAGVVAWEPALDADRNLREMVRAQRLRQLVGNGQESAPSDPFGDDGYVDVAGYPLYRTLWESAAGRRFVDELGPAQRHVLLIQLGRDGSIGPGLAKVSERLQADGRDVTTLAVAANETWWFSNDPTKTTELSTRIVTSTLDWIDRVVGA